MRLQPFLEYARRENLGTQATLRRSLHEAIDALVRDPRLNPTFALAMAEGVGHRLGFFHLQPAEQDALARWFTAEKVTLGELRSLQLFERADRYRARDFLLRFCVEALDLAYLYGEAPGVVTREAPGPRLDEDEELFGGRLGEVVVEDVDR